MKKSHVAALLNLHRCKPVPAPGIVVAGSRLTDAQDRVFYDDGNFHSDNIVAEEIATHRFVLDAILSDDIDANQVRAIIYPISLATIVSPIFQDAAAATAAAEVAALRRSGRPLVLLSLFDFSLGPTERTTPFERALRPSIERDLRCDRIAWVRATDRIVQFESTVDLAANCTLFPLTATPVRAPSADRRWLFSFVGQTTKAHWREGIVRSAGSQPAWDRLSGHRRDPCFIGSTEQGARLVDGNPHFEVPANSTFTLCPRGIGNWTFRLYEAILSGSIPVILSDSYRPPAPDLDWDTFSIRVPENRLAHVAELLSGIKPDEIERRQAGLLEVQHRFTAKGLQRLWVDWLASAFPIAGGHA